MDDPKFATVTLRVKLNEGDTVKTFKQAVAKESRNLFYQNKKLQNGSEKLTDIGIGAESFITNSPISTSNKMFFGRLSVSAFVKLVYGIFSVVRMPQIQKNPNRALQLFSLPVRPGLEMIMNQLDLLSFVRFSSTCTWLRSFSLSSPFLRVKFRCDIDVNIDGWNEAYPTQIRLLFLSDNIGERTVTGVLLENLQKLPLTIKTDLKLGGRQLRAVNLATVTRYLANFKRIVIRQVEITTQDISCWLELIELLKVYSVIYLTIDCRTPLTEEEIERILILNLRHVTFKGHIPRNMFRRTTLQGFRVEESGLTIEEFKEIIELLAYDRLDVNHWTFVNIHADLMDPEAFLECFSQFEFLPYEYEGELPETRPLVTSGTYYLSTDVHILTGRNIVYMFSLNENERDMISIDDERRLGVYLGPNMFYDIVNEEDYYESSDDDY